MKKIKKSGKRKLEIYTKRKYFIMKNDERTVVNIKISIAHGNIRGESNEKKDSNGYMDVVGECFAGSMHGNEVRIYREYVQGYMVI